MVAELIAKMRPESSVDMGRLAQRVALAPSLRRCFIEGEVLVAYL